MKLKPESANVFRRVRDDGGLAERVVFELGSDGQVVKMVHNNNFSYRLQKPAAR
jgi:hypothetical protein